MQLWSGQGTLVPIPDTATLLGISQEAFFMVSSQQIGSLVVAAQATETYVPYAPAADVEYAYASRLEQQEERQDAWLGTAIPR